MTCYETATTIAAYADGEMDGAARRTFEAHLRDCAGCAQRVDDLVALRAQIRSEVPRHAAPMHLRGRVQDAAAMAALPARAERAARWRWLGAGALGGALASAALWLTVGVAVDWRGTHDLAGQAVTSHVQATLDNRLVAVASSDQHTVKPWLSARLDYSPPVRDFTDTGFPLVGGRIDRLDGKPVAVLVYRYRLHTIDVFVRPQGGDAPPAQVGRERGFYVVRALGADMEWIATSDAAPAALKALVEQLAESDYTR
jgi:anti-sigma factor RsiW